VQQYCLPFKYNDLFYENSIERSPRVPRQAKLTTKPDDEAYQRKRTEKLKKANESLSKLPERAPSYFTGTSKTIYSLLVKELNKTGYVSRIDKATFEAFCLQYQVMRESYDAIKEYGVIYNNDGKLTKNPATATFTDASAKLKSLGSELGLSPSSRATLIELAQSDDDSEDKILEMFGGNK